MNKKITWILIIAGLLILGIFKCPLYEISGLPCPTCGMTRAWRSFLTGDFVTAFSMHPLFLVPALIFIPKLRNKWVFWICVGVFVLVYIARMFMLFPDTPPMNYNYQSLLGGFFK